MSNVGADDVEAEGSSADRASQTDAPVSFEEFKLYYQTTERVTDRRHALNQFYYSISVAIIVAVAAVANLALTQPSVRLVAIVFIMVLCAMAFMFCSHWIAQIADAKQLNNAKFKVLEEMAQRLVFEADGVELSARSHKPFVREWQLLQSRAALTDTGTSRATKVLRVLRGAPLRMLSGSSTEFFVPRGFQVLFGGILLVTLVVLVGNFGSIIGTVNPVQPTPSPVQPSP